MSSPAKENVPAYGDAEKGTLEVIPTSTATSDFPVDEKKDLTVVAVNPADHLPSLKKESQPSTKPTPKPKKQVSNWIKFKIWFNTYRYGMDASLRYRRTYQHCFIVNSFA